MFYEQYAVHDEPEQKENMQVSTIKPLVYFVLCLCGVSQVKRPVPRTFDEQVKMSTRINKSLDVLELVQAAVPEILVLNVALDNMSVFDKTTYLVYEVDDSKK